MKYLLVFITSFLLFFLQSSAQNFNKNNKSFVVTHSNSHDINQNWTVSCNNGTFHYENSYYLAYDLQNDFNLNGDWIVQYVSVAVESAVSDNNSQNLIVKLYVMPEYDHKRIIRDSLTLLAEDTVEITAADAGTLVTADFMPGYTVTEGKVLVTEFLLPDGSENNNLLFLGSNDDRISDSTYIRAPFCGYPEPVNVSQILFPEVMIISDVYGVYASPDPVIQSFTIAGQIAVTEIKNEPDYTIKVVMPADTVLSALAPDITIPAGFRVTPASGEIVDFSGGPVVYTVDNNFSKVSQSWDVSVVNAGPDITGAYLPSLNGEVIINGNPDFTVEIPVAEGTDLSNLSPEIFVYDGFTVNPASGSAHDFSSGPVTYTVSHQTLALSQDWQVSVVETPVSTNEIINKEFNLFPVPADSFFKIYADAYLKAEIYDLNGKLIMSSVSKVINTSKLPDGIFFVRIYTENSLINKKIIVKH